MDERETQKTPTLEHEILEVLRKLSSEGVILSELEIQVRAVRLDGQSAGVSVAFSSAALERLPEYGFKQDLIQLFRKLPAFLTTTVVEYYGPYVRISIDSKAYYVQAKNGTRWVTKKTFGQQSDFACTNARLAAQALARTHIGGH